MKLMMHNAIIDSAKTNKKRRSSGENRRSLHALAPSRRVRYSPPVSESTYNKPSLLAARVAV
jgi:hypothetical protein